VVRTLLAAFPRADAFRPGPDARDLLLVASADPEGATGAPSPARLPPALGEMLALAGVPDASSLAARRLADTERLERFAAGAPVATDDDGRIEYETADALLAGQSDGADRILDGIGSAAALDGR
jgi:hypothetical protein